MIVFNRAREHGLPHEAFEGQQYSRIRAKENGPVVAERRE